MPEANIDIDKLKENEKHMYQTPKEKMELCKKVVSMAKSKLMWDHKFYGIIMLNLNTKICNIGTCGVNAKTLFVDPQFICGADEEYLKHQTAVYDVMLEIGIMPQEAYDEAVEGLHMWFSKKTLEEVILILAHECRHIYGATLIRTKDLGYDHKLMNQASDYQINNRLAYEFCKGSDKSPKELLEAFKKKYPIASRILTDEKYFNIEDGKYTEWTTEEIYQDLLKNGKSSNGQGSFDQHFDITPEQAERLKDVIKQAGSQMRAGDIPSDIQMQIDEWSRPKIKWGTYLDRTMKSQIVHDYDYSNPSSRSFALTKNLRKKGLLGARQHVILPSNIKEDTLEVMLVFDSSGSIFCDNDTLGKILGEASGIIKQFPNAKLHVCCFDTKVHNYKVYENAELDDLKNYKIEGGGGSDVTCVGGMIKEDKLDISSIVVFTDLDINCDWDLFKVIKNNIWVVFNNDHKSAPIGKTIHYREDDY